VDVKKGRKLRELRENKGFTLEEVSKKIGVARQTLFKYEANIVTNIPSDKIEALAEIYGTTPAYIMGWDKPKYILEGDDIPPELRELGVDWIRLKKKCAAEGLTAEDISQLIDDVKKIKGVK
jgi:transcriptional regulator with XRE-family HTH domain